ncbi:MAG: hypothetical protein U0Q55_16020 [Vicinamibacterales bacterium]
MRSGVWRVLSVAGIVMLGGYGCARSPVTPTSTATTALDLTGNWAGTASDTSGFGDLRWHLEQTGSTVTGQMDIVDRGMDITGRGRVDGSVLEQKFQFTLTITAGGFDAPMDGCETTVRGEAIAGATSISGTYAGRSTCGGAIYSGQLVLRRL